MTQEEKQLLLKDLCGRLPYITFVYVEWHETEELLICDGCEDEEEQPNIHTLISCDCYGECKLDDNLYKTIYDIKPYLRPMSSMTEEERAEYFLLKHRDKDRIDNIILISEASALMNWLNKNMFDYRDLIPMGLAIEAPEDMYKTE